MMPIPVSPPPAQVQVCGPQVPRLKGRVAIAAAFSSDRALKTALQEVSGAVVVVEEDGAPGVPRLPGAFSFFNGRLTLLRGQSPVNGLGTVLPTWLDPTMGSSNANAATRLYSMVGFGF